MGLFNGIRNASRLVMVKRTQLVIEETTPMYATIRKPEDERRVLGAQMAQLGVRLLNKYGRVLQCEQCGTTWSPELAQEGSLARGFWRCPNRCNW
ncbi:MAG: hypothetical protein ACRD7E_03895 [Bryobacteraceae bacterium]